MPNFVEFSFPYKSASFESCAELMKYSGYDDFQDVLNDALRYLNILKNDTNGKDLCFVIVDEEGFCTEINDQEGENYQTVSNVEFMIDEDQLNACAKKLKMADAREVITKAMILYDKIIDGRQKKCVPGIFNEATCLVSEIVLKGRTHQPGQEPPPLPVFH